MGGRSPIRDREGGELFPCAEPGRVSRYALTMAGLFKKVFLMFLLLLVLGAGVHFALYEKPGVYLWSVGRGEDGGLRIQRTTAGETPVKLATDAVKTGDDSGVILTPADAVNAGAKAGEGGSDSSASTAAPAPEPPSAPAPAPAPEPKKDPNEHVLYDGKALGQWESIGFGGEGVVEINPEGNIEVGFGAIMTGIKWTGEVPAKSNFEIELDAQKIDGNDFFCAITFPVKESHATFLAGGWGGGVVGLSSVDDLDASENETMNVGGFETGRWYHFRVRVTDAKIEAWIDDKQMVDLELKDRKISLRPGDIELCVPLGLASFQTRAQYKNIVWRNLPTAAP